MNIQEDSTIDYCKSINSSTPIYSNIIIILHIKFSENDTCHNLHVTSAPINFSTNTLKIICHNLLINLAAKPILHDPTHFPKSSLVPTPYMSAYYWPLYVSPKTRYNTLFRPPATCLDQRSQYQSHGDGS